MRPWFHLQLALSTHATSYFGQGSLPSTQSLQIFDARLQRALALGDHGQFISVSEILVQNV